MKGTLILAPSCFLTFFPLDVSSPAHLGFPPCPHSQEGPS